MPAMRNVTCGPVDAVGVGLGDIPGDAKPVGVGVGVGVGDGVGDGDADPDALGDGEGERPTTANVTVHEKP
jgi:hypothetical protein